jgi:predicted ATPase
MSAFPGYTRCECIHQGRHYLVYRAWRTDKGQSAVLKTTPVDAPEPVTRLRHEYELLRDLNVEGVVQVLGLEQIDGHLALVMEDGGSHTLKARLGETPLGPSAFFDVALPLAETVAQLHHRQIVHGDLNPTNILWEAETGRLTVIDFGIALRQSASDASDTSPGRLQGTLPYLSPEQTGRTGHAVDHRTDLYTLGATFYELVTGVPPFVTTEPVELIHAHLARLPMPPHERNTKVPLGLSALILKLLAKTPEERYQTTEALFADLQSMQAQWTRTGHVESFSLARLDVARALRIPEKLFGRADETQVLLDAFTRVCEERHELVLVTGAPGIGKSALVQLLKPHATQQGAHFIGGKFDQLQRSVPYAPLVDAFRTLIEQLLREPDVVLAVWRERLQEAVAPNGQLLTDLIPEVEHVLGPQPAVPELGPIEARNRLTLVFQAFVRALAKPQHPLVLFLDDLQWADPASLQLVQQLVCDTEMSSLLLIGAYRETEVGPEHSLSVALKDLREVGVAIQEIRLDALGLAEVTALCAESLSCGSARARPLAELILNKTAGNPFFVRRLLRSLVEDGLLQRDEMRRAWNWDVQELARVGLTDNVVDILVKTIERLPAPTRDILMTAACVGNRVNVSLLAAVHAPPLSTANHLWPALEAGLLVAHESSMKRSPGENREVLPLPDQAYQFVHDRVQQAAYSLLPDSRKTALHLHIARVLLQAGPGDELEDRLFDVVDQFNLGASFIQDESERLQLAELNLRAGRKAKAAAAYRAALEYLTAGMNALSQEAWERHGVLAFALHRDRAECAYLAGEHALAEQLIEIALTHTPCRTAKADLYHIRIVAATASGDYAGAIHWGREGLALFGQELPSEQVGTMVQDEFSTIMGILGTRGIEELAAEAETRDAGVLTCMRLLSSLGPPTFFSNQDLCAFVMTRLVNLSLRHGPSIYSAHGYTY